MFMSTALLSLILLSLLPFTAVCLTCYLCVHPTVSPLDCHPVPKKCASGERCLYSSATVVKGSKRIVLKEKSCAAPSNCGISKANYIAGLYFTSTTRCCDTDLCNTAAMTVVPCWSRAALSLWCMGLAVVLSSV